MMLTVSCKKESINAAVIEGKGRRFVVHFPSIITLRNVENDFRLGNPTKPRFRFQYGRVWIRRIGQSQTCSSFHWPVSHMALPFIGQSQTWLFLSLASLTHGFVFETLPGRPAFQSLFTTEEHDLFTADDEYITLFQFSFWKCNGLFIQRSLCTCFLETIQIH